MFSPIINEPLHKTRVYGSSELTLPLAVFNSHPNRNRKQIARKANIEKRKEIYASFSSHIVVPVSTIVKLKAPLGGLSLDVSVRRICAR